VDAQRCLRRLDRQPVALDLHAHPRHRHADEHGAPLAGRRRHLAGADGARHQPHAAQGPACDRTPAVAGRRRRPADHRALRAAPARPGAPRRDAAQARGRDGRAAARL
jgi:hypothetical protein